MPRWAGPTLLAVLALVLFALRRLWPDLWLAGVAVLVVALVWYVVRLPPRPPR
ncbi:MAG TPA: hypothetical protein VFA70_06085 [Dehalococcoidia bacterium]|nr:hypothetical protein [Dehalococcoidia bacterium]